MLELDPGDMDALERLALAQIIEDQGAASARHAPRLIVLGNCQSYAMSACLRALIPGAGVAALSWTELRTPAQVERLLTVVDDVDAVLAQEVDWPEVQALSPRALAARGIRNVQFPRIHFTGFHPDAMRIGGRELKGLIGPWHSALIIAGYCMGLSEERTGELFNAYIYGALGYFEEYAKARRFLETSFDELGWDPRLVLRDEAGVFVHVPNHPRIETMMDLARFACTRLGVTTDDAAAPPPDLLLRNGVWPVYPEIGKRIGVAGRLQFSQPWQPPPALDLGQAIACSYTAYSKAPRSALTLPRVEKLAAMLKGEGI